MDNTTISDLTTEITVLVRNHSSSEVNKTLESNFNIRKLTPLNRVLIDTGASRTIVSRHVILAELFENRKSAKETVWKTNGGPFVTKHELELRFVFPEFAPSKEITWTVAVNEFETRPIYDMIIGRDHQKSLGMDILWSVGQIPSP